MMQQQGLGLGPGPISTNAPRLLVPKAGMGNVLDEPFLAQSPNVGSAIENSLAGPFQQQHQQQFQQQQFQQQEQPHPNITPGNEDLEPLGSLSLPGLAAPAYLMPSNPGTPTGSPYASPRRNMEPRAGGSFGHSNLRPPSKLGPGAGSLQSRMDG